MTNDEFDFWEMVADAKESPRARRRLLSALGDSLRQRTRADRDRTRHQRAALLEKTHLIKASSPCADCGRTFPPEAMDFDHVSGNKIMPVSAMVNYGMKWGIIEAEIAKCELVCAVCHRVRTRRRRSGKLIEDLAIPAS